MRNKALVPMSVLVSLAIHLAVLGSSRFVWLHAASGLTSETVEMFHLRKPVELPRSSLSRGEAVSGYVDRVKFEKPDSELKDLFQRSLKFTGHLEQREPESVVAGAPEELKDFKTEKKPAEDLKETVAEVTVGTRRVFDKDTAAELNVLGALREAPAETGEALEISEGFAEGIEAFTPTAVPIQSWESSLAESRGSAVGTTSRYESIDDFLNVRLAVYRDPQDGQGYFEIAIFPGSKAAELPAMPKELVFLVDASSSIEERRMHEFKKGIRYALERLGPGDSFNVISFKEKIDRFRPAPVPASPETVASASAFLDGIKPSQRTDLFQVFFESMQTPPSVHPSYMVVLSDGVPTHGVTSSAKLIAEIGRQNAGRRAIFAMSGGARVNRFLLDFLSYQNRGWSEYAKTQSTIGRRLAEMYEKIRNPVLVNVRYQLSQIDPGEIYPRALPDFYRDTEFLIYGRFRDETRFSVRILGEEGGKTKEFIFGDDFTGAAQGTVAIAERWALNKMYHLISRMALEGADPQSKAEVEALSRRFGLRIPYKFEKLV